MDLKKLSINGIKYASIDEKLKEEIMEKQFKPKWDVWIKKINSNKY